MNKLRKTEAFEVNKKVPYFLENSLFQKIWGLICCEIREYKNTAEPEKIRICGIYFVLRENQRKLRGK